MDERTEQAFVDTLRVTKEALQELRVAAERHDEQIKELQARVEALERLRLPRPVPPPRSGR
jgi:predicted RecB family endonuclease